MLRLFRQLYTIRNLFFIFAEGFFIYFSVIISSLILLGPSIDIIDVWLNMKSLIITFVCIICLYYNSVYDINLTKKYSELSIRLMQSFGAALIILAGIYAVFQNVIICRGLFLIYLPIVMSLIALWRFIYLAVLKKGFLNTRIIILGSGDIAQGIINTINEEIDCGFTLVGAVEENSKEDKLLFDDSSAFRINDYENLYKIARKNGVEQIIVAIKEKRGGFPLKPLLKCRVEGIDIIDGNSFYEMLTGKLIVTNTNPTWLIFSGGFKKTPLQNLLKRIEDIILSLTLLLILSPVAIITGILIKFESKGPMFFSQERLGKRKRSYMVHKFRSMRTDAEKESGPVWAKTNDDRVTRVGRFIRKWRVDEIPQLWNVLMGDMSMIGPRPEREFFVDQLEEIIPYFSERFSVKPGLTGWAQVCYGYGDSVEDAIEKLNYDLFYIKNMSIFLDIVIVFRTVKTVLFGVGAR